MTTTTGRHGQPLPAEIETISPPVLECADCGGPVPDVAYVVRREPNSNITETLCYTCASRWGGMIKPPSIERFRLESDYPWWRPNLDEWLAIPACPGCGRGREVYWPQGWLSYLSTGSLEDDDLPSGVFDIWPRSQACSPQCRRHVRRWTRRHVRPEHRLACQHCGAAFTAQRADARFCSPAHRVAALRIRRAHETTT